jgi:predicted metal-binding membrane protein
MTTFDTANSRAGRLELAQFVRRFPEMYAAGIILTAWVILVIVTVTRGDQAMTMMGTMAGSMPSMGNGPTASTAGSWATVRMEMPYALLMTFAMMGPAALPGIRHAAVNSLRARRGRAMSQFALGYLATWVAFVPVSLVLAVRVADAPESLRLGVALVMAAAWQISPTKRRYLQGCFRSVPLRPHGWRATWSSCRFGLVNGSYCVGSCWVLMLVMAVASHGELLWTAAIATIVTIERRTQRPRRTTRIVAFGLAVAAAGALLLSLA